MLLAKRYGTERGILGIGLAVFWEADEESE
jgi:hypothetical protein